MASGTRSSKRKSSPSISKKPRIKDRSKKRSKTLKRKSKKVSRRESPDSYSDSESLSSVSYSSSDTDSRRSRSRIRKDAKKKSRGSRFRSRSIDNTVNERRGKRSKKSKGTDAKKKNLRKKRKREPSMNSSDRSVSCSTCRSSDDSEGENRKTEKRRMKRSERDFDDYRRWGGHRSRSCSPCRLDGVDGRYLSVEHNLVENNPRRLRSIIIVAKEFEEKEEETKLIDKDVHKEEIIFDQDDYPSPRSNDSHDLQVQHEKIVGFKVEHDMITSTSDQAIVSGSIEVCEAKVSSADPASNPTDLEAVLRQKALENLKKFKGGVRPNVKKPISIKSSIDGELKQSSSINGTLELLKKDQEGNVGCNMGEFSALNKSAAKILPILSQDSEMVNPSKEGSADVEKLEGGEGEVPVLKEGNIKEDKLAEQALPTQETPLINMLTTESLLLPSRNGKGLADSVDSVKGKQETVSLERLGSHKLDSSMIPIEEASKAMSVLAKGKGVVESEHPSNDAKSVTNDAEKTPTEGVDKTISNLEGQSSNAKGREEGDSQFQQKTMSVMRGGEMVQVNYKVYIPKHVPALARRKLKR